MQKYELPGEQVADVFPAHVERMEFHGVEILRIIGVAEQITETTRMIDDLYPFEEKEPFGDAQHIGFARDAGQKPIAMYELLVLRKVSDER